MLESVKHIARSLASKMRAEGETPMLQRSGNPAKQGERRLLEGLHPDMPEEWNDLIGFFAGKKGDLMMAKQQ